MTFFDRLKNVLTSKKVQADEDIPVNLYSNEPDHSASIRERIYSSTENEKKELIAQLTPREYDVYIQLLEGYTLKEAAKRLSIKYSTANSHMSGIYRKLHIKSIAELIINYRSILNKPSRTKILGGAL
jgi:DNA-binding CsgD family transcriptional regulator